MVWRKRVAVAAVLLALAAIPHWRFVLLGEVPLPEGYLALIAPEAKPLLRPTAWNALWWDSIGQFWAWRTEAMRQLAEGRLPLWSNRIGCGFPFLANPQTQTLYPPAWVAQIFAALLEHRQPLPLQAAKATAWLAFFHTLLALMGAYLLLRSFSMDRTTAIVGAAANALGSFAIAWALLPTLPATAAWLPLALWLLRCLISACVSQQTSVPRPSSPVPFFAVVFAGAVAMLLLAGHGQIAIYALLVIVVFAGVELLAYRQAGAKALLCAALTFLAAMVLAMMLAAAQLLPSAELAPLTHRHAPPTWEGYQAFAQRGLTLVDLATFVLPFLFGNPVTGTYFGKESFADYCAYAGLGIFVAAAIAVLFAFVSSALKSRSPVPNPQSLIALRHGVALFLLGILLATGSTVNLPLYFLLPGFAQLGTPTRAVFLCQLALGMLAAVALNAWVKNAAPQRGLSLTIVGLAVLLLVASVVGSGVWLQSLSPLFDWSEWLATAATENIGVVAGLLAVSLLALTLHLRSPVPSPLLRLSVPLLLIAELVWFAAQQIPSARVERVQSALHLAEEQLLRTVELPKMEHLSIPLRLLPLGSDWSLRRYPQSLLPPNSLLLLSPRWADGRNYDSLLLRHHKTVLALFSNGNPCPLENGNLILLLQRQVSLEDGRKLARLLRAILLRPTDDGWTVGGNDVHRSFVPHSVRYAANLEDAFAQLRDMSENEAMLVALQKPHRSTGTESAQVTLDKDAQVRVVVSRSEGAVHPVWVVLADTVFSGWRAFGRNEKSWRAAIVGIANGAFRACHVPEAKGEILWVYFPTSFALGAFISLTGVALAFGLLCFCCFRSPKSLEA